MTVDVLETREPPPELNLAGTGWVTKLMLTADDIGDWAILQLLFQELSMNTQENVYLALSGLQGRRTKL